MSEDRRQSPADDRGDAGASDPLPTLPAVGSPEFFKAIVETAANPFVVVDDQLILRYASASLEMLLGFKPEEWIGRSVTTLLSPDSLHLALSGISEIGMGSRSPNWVGAPLRLFLTNADGESVPVDVYSRDTSRTGIGGALVQLVRAGAPQTMSDAVDTLLEGKDFDLALSLLTSLVEHDITESAASLGSAWDGERFGHCAGYGRVLSLTALESTDRDAIQEVLASSHRVADILGALSPTTQEAASNRGWKACWCAPVPADQGEDRTAAMFIWRGEEGPPGVIFRDAIKNAVNLARLAIRWMGQQQGLNWSATHDQLTGLTNRAEFQNHLDATTGQPRAVLFCDLDDFKPINENFGHRVGDRVLHAVAARLKGVCSDCVVARLGGDEFAVLLRSEPSLEGARGVAEAIRAIFDDPIAIEGNTVDLGVTIGLAFDPAGTTDSDHLMDHADALLRRGKVDGKNTILSVTIEG